MTADVKPYPAMKDSGAPWLGKVPEHWRTERAKWLFRKINRPIRESDEVVTCFRDGTVTLRKNRRVRGFTESLKEIGYQGIRRGDLVIHAMDAFAGAVGVSDVDGKGTPVYSVCEPRSMVDPHYYAYAIREMARSQWIQALAKGIRERSTDFRFEGFGSQPVPLPPLREQIAIVRFLDHADRRIRRYIRAKQKLIKLLEEQKQAIIHRAVTRGLNPNVCFKPSGVDWIGDVPAHWQSRRLKTVLSRPIRNGLFKKKDFFGRGVPLVNVADVYHHTFQVQPERLERVEASPEEIRTYEVQSGDMFFVRSSLKLEGTGRSAVAVECEPGTVFECHLVQGRPARTLADPLFLIAQLNSFGLRHLLIARANVVTMATIAQDVIASCPLWLPPLAEQSAIVRYLDRKTRSVAAAADSAIEDIRLAREYRTRLIADVVTGKLDVREAAARLPKDAEECEMSDEIESEAGPEEADEGLDTVPAEPEA